MFNDEIDHLYAAMVGEQSWSSFLQRLVVHVPGGKATLQMYDCLNPENSFVALQTGFDNAALAAYVSHYAKANLLQQSLAARPDGIAFADDALVSEDMRAKDSFFNEWLTPNDVQSSAGLKIQTSGARAVSLVLLSDRANDTCRRNMKDTLDNLAPHLNRVSAFYRRHDHVTQRDGVDSKLANQFGAGILLLKSDGHIGFMNDAARQLLESRTSALCFNSSRLRIRDHKLSNIVCEMMKPRYEGAKAVDYYSSGLKLSLFRPEQDSVEALLNGTRLIISLTWILSTPLRFDRKLMAQTYGLTAAEMRAVDGLVTGKSAGIIASEAGLSRETIRAQIRSLYAKTGARSQADIIRLVRPR